MIDVFQTPYYRIPQPEPDMIQSSLSPQPCQNRKEIFQLFKFYLPYDLASLLLRCLNTCAGCSNSIALDSCKSDGWDISDLIRSNTFLWESNNNSNDHNKGGIVPIQAGNLLFQATALEYDLDLTESNDQNIQNHWIYKLCRARQLLTYRIVLQFIIPAPERYILLNILRLFRLIHDNCEKTKMSAECLARCTAFAIFGAPNTNVQNVLHNSKNQNSHKNPLKWRIDTLKNLIMFANELEDLPTIVYEAIRDRLRSRLGNSPVPRQNNSLRLSNKFSDDELDLLTNVPIFTNNDNVSNLDLFYVYFKCLKYNIMTKLKLNKILIITKLN